MGKQLLFSVTLKDCEVETKRGHGKGGQNRNTRDTAVRIRHKLSNAVGESQEQRNQLQNKRTAFLRMTKTPEFRKWLAQERWIRAGFPSPEEAIEKEMTSENIRVEVKKDGKWSRL